MADQSLQILIEFILKGGPEAEKALASVRKAAAEGSADAQTALKELGKEKANATDATKKATETEKEHTAQTDKVVEAKKRWRDQLKGLALEFPGLARAISLLTNPTTAFTAGLAIAVAKLDEFLSRRLAVQRLVVEMDRLRERTKSIAQVSAEVADESARAINSLNEMKNAAQGYADAMDQANAAAISQMQLAAQLDDDKTQLALAEIDASMKPESVKNRERMEVLRKARQTKSATEEATLREQMLGEDRKAEQLDATAADYRKRALAMDPQIKAARDQAQVMDGEAAVAEATLPKQIEKEGENLAQTREGIKQGGGYRGLKYYSKEHLLEFEKHYTEQIKFLKTALGEAKQAATDAQKNAEDLDAQKSALLEQAGAAGIAADVSRQRSGVFAEGLNAKNQNNLLRGPILARTEDLKLQSQNNQLGGAALAEFNQSVNSAASMIGAGASPAFVGRNAPLPTELRNADALKSVLAAFGKDVNGTVATLIAEVQKLRDELAVIKSQQQTRRSY